MTKIFQHFNPIMKPAFLLTTPKLCLKRTFVSGQSSLPHEWFLILENLWTFIRFCSGSMIAVFQDTRFVIASSVCQCAAVSVLAFLLGLTLHFEV